MVIKIIRKLVMWIYLVFQSGMSFQKVLIVDEIHLQVVIFALLLEPKVKILDSLNVVMIVLSEVDSHFLDVPVEIIRSWLFKVGC